MEKGNPNPESSGGREKSDLCDLPKIVIADGVLKIETWTNCLAQKLENHGFPVAHPNFLGENRMSPDPYKWSQVFQKELDDETIAIVFSSGLIPMLHAIQNFKGQIKSVIAVGAWIENPVFPKDSLGYRIFKEGEIFKPFVQMAQSMDFANIREKIKNVLVIRSTDDSYFGKTQAEEQSKAIREAIGGSEITLSDVGHFNSKKMKEKIKSDGFPFLEQIILKLAQNSTINFQKN